MEIWDLYDENQQVTGKTHIRGEEIPDGFYHLAVHVWIRNKKGEYLISRRSADRPTYPNMLECVGGSVLAGESSKQGAVREAIEEVGIDLSDVSGKVVFNKIRGIIDGKKFNDILDVWLFEFDGEANLQFATTAEVSETEWKTIDEIHKIYEDGNLVPTLEYIFDIDKKMQNIQKNITKKNKNKKKIKKLSENSRYFDFYDDVKAGCHKIVDW